MITVCSSPSAGNNPGATIRYDVAGYVCPLTTAVEVVPPWTWKLPLRIPAQKPSVSPPISKSNPSGADGGNTALATKMASLVLMLSATKLSAVAEVENATSPNAGSGFVPSAK
eukprot:3711069-Rhodomonas_salina.6